MIITISRLEEIRRNTELNKKRKGRSDKRNQIKSNQILKSEWQSHTLTAVSISSVCDRDDKVVLVLFQLLLDIMLFFTSADVHYSCSMMIMRMLVVVMVEVIVMVMMIDFTNQSSTLTTSHQTNDSINHKEKCASKLLTRNHSTFPLAFFFFAAKRMTASVSFLLLLEQNRCQCADGKHIHRDKWNAFDLKPPKHWMS